MVIEDRDDRPWVQAVLESGWGRLCLRGLSLNFKTALRVTPKTRGRLYQCHIRYSADPAVWVDAEYVESIRDADGMAHIDVIADCHLFNENAKATALLVAAPKAG